MDNENYLAEEMSDQDFNEYLAAEAEKEEEAALNTDADSSHNSKS